MLMDAHHWTYDETRAMPARVIHDLIQMRNVRAQVQEK